jgi:hypothetical protein
MFRKIWKWIFGKPEIKIIVDDEPKYLIESYFDEDSGKLTIIQLVCACGWPVAEFADNKIEYWCEHCDRGCPEGLPTCQFCIELYVSKTDSPPPAEES